MPNHKHNNESTTSAEREIPSVGSIVSINIIH